MYHDQQEPLFARRQQRTRYALRQAAGVRPRLSRFPLVAAHLRAGHRRHAGRDARGRLDRSTKALKGKLKTGADKAAATRSAS